MPTSTTLPDGVYLGLDFEDYLAQRGRLGSTDKSKLHQAQEGYWWQTPMNPYYKPKRAEHLVEGEAIHALLLEGLAAYEARFIVEPDPQDHPDALFTIPQIKAAFERANIALTKTGSWVKEDWVAAVQSHLPHLTVWDAVYAAFDDTRGDRKPVSARFDFEVRAMWECALDNDGPAAADLRNLLSTASQFPVLAEVSVLYTDPDGLRHRARFDKLLPTFTMDLKSVGNWSGRQLRHKVDGLIKDNGYDIQLADYQHARRRGFQMVLEDELRLVGGTDAQRTHLLAMANYDLTHKPDWSWLFFQKPDCTAGRAPVLLPLKEAWAGPYHRSGWRKRQRALALYRDCMERFGLAQPWSRVEPLHYTTEANTPHITQSHYDWDEEPVDGEAEELDR